MFVEGTPRNSKFRIYLTRISKFIQPTVRAWWYLPWIKIDLFLSYIIKVAELVKLSHGFYFTKGLWAQNCNLVKIAFAIIIILIPNMSEYFQVRTPWNLTRHYDDVGMGAMASQITSLMIVYSTVYSDADQSKQQSSASLAFVREIHRGPVNFLHKWPVTRKMFPFDDVIMVIFR